MGPKTLFMRIYFAFILVTSVPSLLFLWYVSGMFTQFFRTETVNELTERAYQIGSLMEGNLGAAEGGGIDSLCKVLSKGTEMRLTVIATDGTVLGDSRKDPDSMENHANRMEVIAARNGRTGIANRFSHTLGNNMIYVAIPVWRSSEVAGIVRTAISTSTLERELRVINLRIGGGYVLLAIFAAAVSLLLSRNIAQPIGSMKLGAQRFATGDFGGKLRHWGCLELDQLSDALNGMALRLKTTIESLVEQNNRMEAVLSGMTEGVIAIDDEQRIMAFNQAAAAQFAVPSIPAKGTWIGEVLRNPRMNELFLRIRRSGEPLRETVTLAVGELHGENADRVVELSGNVLRDAEGEIIGVLAVINDVTRLKRLETVRSDFVANVSHELRTPLTSVKGFVETLLSGAISDPGESRRFLDIINRQVERLSTIVEDLLTLSRIEQDVRTHRPMLRSANPCSVIAAAVETCGIKARDKEIRIDVECDPALHAWFEPDMIEEALVNLIDNAINYSSSGGRVTVRASVDAKERKIVFSVEDDGPGIAPQHHDRIFERFYRVDKARSRKQGGTGLGLAIVKHIAMVHGGRIGVKSAPGEGSTFFLDLPFNIRNEEEGAHENG